MNEFVFCPNCGDYKNVTVKQEIETYTVRGEQITISAEVAYCDCCGEQVWADKYDNANLKRAYDAYRIKNNLLLPEQIRAIREKYGLTQVAFARVLGLGDKTIARYENGSIQDAANNSLLAVSDKPDVMRYLLDLNKASFSQREYERIKQAIDVLKVSVVSKSFSCEANYSAERSKYKIESKDLYWGGLSYAG